jgi:hypothetical protein
MQGLKRVLRSPALLTNMEGSWGSTVHLTLDLTRVPTMQQLEPMKSRQMTKLVGSWDNKAHWTLELKKVPTTLLGLRTRQVGSWNSRVHSTVVQTQVLRLVPKMERRGPMRLQNLGLNLKPLVGNWGNMVNLKPGWLM